MRNLRHHTVAALAVVLGAGGAIGLPMSAMADDVPIDFVFTEPAVSVEYGQYWGLSGAAPGFVAFSSPGTDPTTVAISGLPDYLPMLQTNKNGEHLEENLEASIWPSSTQPAMNAGTYTVSLTTSGIFMRPGEIINEYRVASAPNATLTITKAPLAVDFRMLADTSNRDGAVVSGRLTGTFANDYAYAAGYPSSGIGPGGSWLYSISDADGEVVLERTITTEPGDLALATSFYWADAEPGETYTGTIEFTPDTASAVNFAITQAPEFSYTAPELQRPVPASTLAPVAEPAPEQAADFAVPLWLLILIGVVALGLAAAVVLLSLRYVRLRHEPDLADTVSPTTKELVR